MTSTTLAPTQPSTRPQHSNLTTDVSRGARQCDIKAHVFIETEILDNYSELDPSLGQNTIGVVLAVLSCHLHMSRGGLGEDTITVCLLRRQDDRVVELDLGLHRRRHAAGECFELRRLAEREVDVTLHAAG